MMDLPIQPITREERLSDRVAKQLEELILRGLLKTGLKLPSERELADLFGVSRTVIREAVHNLSARGLLEARAGGGGTFVRAPSTDSVTDSLSLLLRSRSEDYYIEHLHEVRRVLEVEIAGLAAERASEQDLKKLEAILQQMEESREDHEVSATLDVEFHKTLAVAARNPIFLILLESIGDILLEIRRLSLKDPETVPKALFHHRNVLESVKTRDPQLAREAMAAHIAQSVDTMRSVLKPEGKPGHPIHQVVST